MLARPPYWTKDSKGETEQVPGWSQMQVWGTVTQCLALVLSPVSWETELSACPTLAEILTCLQKKGGGKGGKKTKNKNQTTKTKIPRPTH